MTNCVMHLFLLHTVFVKQPFPAMRNRNAHIFHTSLILTHLPPFMYFLLSCCLSSICNGKKYKAYILK